jgi:hypothetical protein
MFSCGFFGEKKPAGAAKKTAASHAWLLEGPSTLLDQPCIVRKNGFLRVFPKKIPAGAAKKTAALVELPSS